MGLHAWSISYCDAELTDGFVPVGALPQLKGAGQAVKVLVASGRWGVVDGGYELHDYLHYNHSRSVVMAKRSANATRQARFRNGVINTDGNASVTSIPVPVPVPVPGIVPKSDSRTPPNPPRKRRGRSSSLSSNGLEFDDDGPKYEQRVDADGKREWVQVDHE
jgi:hypothetical protein